MKKFCAILLAIFLSGCAETISENPINVENAFGPNFDFKCYNSCKDRNYEEFCIKKCNLD